MTFPAMILALLAATVAFTNATINTEPVCGNVRPGRYCNNDLSGFKICGGQGEVETASCAADHMCSCGFNRRCDEDEGCVERPKFDAYNGISTDFIALFTGKRLFTFPTGSQDEVLTGHYRQDTTPGDEKMFIQTTFTSGSTSPDRISEVIRVIRKDEAGQFIEVGTKFHIVISFFIYSSLFSSLMRDFNFLSKQVLIQISQMVSFLQLFMSFALDKKYIDDNIILYMLDISKSLAHSYQKLIRDRFLWVYYPFSFEIECFAFIQSVLKNL